MGDIFGVLLELSFVVGEGSGYGVGEEVEFLHVDGYLQKILERTSFHF